jgi:hypothetical protein
MAGSICEAMGEATRSVEQAAVRAITARVANFGRRLLMEYTVGSLLGMEGCGGDLPAHKAGLVPS